MISFGAPLVLFALLALPAVWWLLRLMPPQPRRLRFPAIEFLRGLVPDRKEAAHTPPWLLILRMVILALVIVAMADPVRNAAEPLPAGAGPVLIVIDNGWEAAVNWDVRQKMLERVAGQAARADRSVILLPTAPPADGGLSRMIGPLRSGEIQDTIKSIKPMPWAKNPAKVAADVLGGEALAGNPYIIWLGDGFSGEGSDDFMSRLATLGKVLYVADDKTNTPIFLDPVNPEDKDLIVKVTAADISFPLHVTLLAEARDGRVLAQSGAELSPENKTAKARFDLLPELRHQVFRVFAREKPGAAATLLLEGGKWRPVGILADTGAEKGEGYLSDVFYLNRALEPFADVKADGLDQILEKERAVIFWPDSYILSTAEREKLSQWVEAGGHLVRFAGSNLGKAGMEEMPLLPVALRAGGRNLEGTLVWSQPQHVAPIDKASPLYGIEVPDDVTVERQVLAEPSPELEDTAIVKLADGTPLVTTANMGMGRVTLVHTTAGPEWSNLSLSGFFVAMLKQFIEMGAGLAPSLESPLVELHPLQIMDGFGRLVPAPSFLAPIRGNAFKDARPSPATPPGVYGDQASERAINLAGRLVNPEKIGALPRSFEATGYIGNTEEKLKGALLFFALALLLVDTAASLWLQGALLQMFRKSAPLVLLGMFFTHPVLADDGGMEKYANHTHFAFVKSGDAGQDSISQAGLEAVCRAVTARTSSNCEGVIGVVPGLDELSLFPFLYWPMTANQKVLTEAGAKGLRRYLDYGGLLLIDTRDEQYSGGGLGENILRDIMRGIELPPLMAIPSDHILSRSFYLLGDYPGRWTGGKIWVEKTVSTAYDNVPTVVIGGNDWASAWAVGSNGSPVYTLSGGERQREMALRFGVNLAMVAMTGSYKADQVHLPHILERLGR